MAYLAIVWVAYGLLQLASGQDACTNAAVALQANTACFNALSSADGTVICSDTCRALLDDVINNCQGNQVHMRTLYSYVRSQVYS